MDHHRDHDDLLDERELVEQARVDVDAFAVLYGRYVDRIHAFAHRRCGDGPLAEDITAATFERALRGLDGFSWGPGGIGPWLFRIAANELTDHHRRRGRRRGDRAQRAADRLQDRAAIDDLDRIDESDRIAILRAGLDSLNPRYQRVLVLRHLSGLGHEEAARAMGLTPSLMAVLVHRANAALRRAVERLEEPT
ncbi:MAG: sigma-70 family RNA polymerase sigma factor [Acidimicrobiales bacterium]